MKDLKNKTVWIIGYKLLDAYIFWGGRAGWQPNPLWSHQFKTEGETKRSIKNNAKGSFKDKDILVKTLNEWQQVFNDEYPVAWNEVENMGSGVVYPKKCERCERETMFHLSFPQLTVCGFKSWCGCEHESINDQTSWNKDGEIDDSPVMCYLPNFANKTHIETNHIVNLSSPTANMFGCEPCPVCNNKQRWINQDKTICCYECGYQKDAQFDKQEQTQKSLHVAVVLEVS